MNTKDNSGALRTEIEMQKELWDNDRDFKNLYREEMERLQAENDRYKGVLEKIIALDGNKVACLGTAIDYAKQFLKKQKK